MKATSPSHNIARGAVSGPGQSGSANPAANLMIEDLDEFPRAFTHSAGLGQITFSVHHQRHLTIELQWSRQT